MYEHPTGPHRRDFKEFVDTMIQSNAVRPNPAIQVGEIALQSGIEKRRLYDLMNVLVSCDVCMKVDTRTYRWLSLGNVGSAIFRIAGQVEIAAREKCFEEMFRLQESPSIGLMATTFIGTFLYFNAQTMNIRTVAWMMANDRAHFKPIIRRLYLVAFLLERIGLFRHDQKIGDYRILIAVDEVCRTNLVRMGREKRFAAESIDGYLNRLDEPYLRAVFGNRKEMLEVKYRASAMEEGDIVKLPIEVARMKSLKT